MHITHQTKIHIPSNDVAYEVTTYNNAWLVEATIENHTKLWRSNLISSTLFFSALASKLMVGRKAIDIGRVLPLLLATTLDFLTL